MLHLWLTKLLVVFCCVFAHVDSSHAGITDLQIEVFEDKTAQLTIEDVEKQAFAPTGITFARGYSQSAFWFRLTLAPDDVERVLRIRPPYLDNLALYLPDQASPGRWTVLRSGDQAALHGTRHIATSGADTSDATLPGLSLAFALPASSQTQTLYLRLQTESSSLINFEVLTLADYQQAELRSVLWHLFLVTAMLTLLIFASVDYIVSKQTVVGLFVLQQIAQIGYVLALGGYLPFILPDIFNADIAASTIVVLTVMITLLFHRTLIREFEPNRWALRTLSAMIIASTVALLLLMAGRTQSAMQLTSLMVALFAPVLVWLSCCAKRNQSPGLATLRVTYVTLAGVLFFVMAPIFGIWVSFELYLWATMTQGLIAGLIMAVFLARRSIELRRRAVQDQLALARYEEKLKLEQRNAADQRQFLDMLAHELKTPLGVIQFTLDSVELPAQQQKRLHRSLETMSAVIDRCRLSLQLDEGRLHPKFERCDIGVEVENLVLACKEPERIQFECDESGACLTDRELFAIIVQNLLDNAVKYSTEGSLITVGVHAKSHNGRSGISVCVHNFVSHAPATQSDQLFEKYFRGTNARSKTGSGLGLHLSLELAKIIKAQLQTDIGLNDIRFCLWIPD